MPVFLSAILLTWLLITLITYSLTWSLIYLISMSPTSSLLVLYVSPPIFHTPLTLTLSSQTITINRFVIKKSQGGQIRIPTHPIPSRFSGICTLYTTTPKLVSIPTCHGLFSKAYHTTLKHPSKFSRCAPNWLCSKNSLHSYLMKFIGVIGIIPLGEREFSKHSEKDIYM